MLSLLSLSDTFATADEPILEQGLKSEWQEDMVFFLAAAGALHPSQEEFLVLGPRPPMTIEFSRFVKYYEWWEKILVIILCLRFYLKPKQNQKQTTPKSPQPNQGVQQ